MASQARTRLTNERKAWREGHPVGYFARLKKKDDGSQDLMVWECGIPGRVGVRAPRPLSPPAPPLPRLERPSAPLPPPPFPDPLGGRHVPAEAHL